MPFRKAGLPPPDDTTIPDAPATADRQASAKARNGSRTGRAKPASRTAAAPDLASLIAALDDPDPHRRQSAIRALAGSAEALPHLCGRLSAETDEPTRETLALLLSRADGTAVAEGLLPLLRSRDAALRSVVVEILRHHPDGINPLLPALLADPDPHFRIHVLMIVKLLPVIAHAEVLADLLRNDPDINVAASVLDIIHDRQTEVHVSDMQTLVGSLAERFPDQPFIHFAANRILKNPQSSAR